VHPHIGHSSDRKRCPGGPHTCEHQRTHAGLSSTRQLPPIACTPSLAAALVGTPQQRLASAKSAASTKLWKRPGLPPGMLQHSPCDRPPTCRQQRSALTSPTAWHTIWSRRYSALGAARARAHSNAINLRIPQNGARSTFASFDRLAMRFFASTTLRSLVVDAANRLCSRSKLAKVERAPFCDALRWLPATLRGCGRRRALRSAAPAAAAAGGARATADQSMEQSARQQACNPGSEI
jgi:hypothetical protein